MNIISFKKEENPAIYNKIDEHYDKWDKSNTER